MKGLKITYWIATGILTVIMLLSVGMYLFNNSMVQGEYTALGYPTYLIYPLAIAKLLGLGAIHFSRNRALREWAYAGFFFNTVLAIMAHLAVNDGKYAGAVVAFLAVIISYTTRKKLAKN